MISPDYSVTNFSFLQNYHQWQNKSFSLEYFFTQASILLRKYRMWLLLPHKTEHTGSIKIPCLWCAGWVCHFNLILPFFKIFLDVKPQIGQSTLRLCITVPDWFPPSTQSLRPTPRPHHRAPVLSRAARRRGLRPNCNLLAENLKQIQTTVSKRFLAGNGAGYRLADRSAQLL